jgi:LemA protein
MNLMKGPDMQKNKMIHLGNKDFMKIGILMGLFLTISSYCLGQTLNTARASEAVKRAFSLTDQDKIEILGIAEDTKTTNLVKFSVNGKQATGKIRKYDQGWQLDDIQDELGSWLPVTSVIRQLEGSLPILSEKARNQLAQIENVYQRRADIVPNLIQMANEPSNSEKSTFTAVIDARVAVGQLNLTANNTNAETFARYLKAQDNLSSALARLLVVMEKYPNIKKNINFRQLLTQLEGTENRIVVERMRYNEAATEYNNNVSRTMACLLGKRNEMPIFKPSGSVPPPPVRF